MKKTAKEILAKAGFELTYFKSYRTGTNTMNTELAASNGSTQIAVDIVYKVGDQHKLKEALAAKIKEAIG